VIAEKVRIKINNHIIDNTSHSSEIEKLFAFPELEELGMIDQHVQVFRVYDVHTLKEKKSYSIPKCTITGVHMFSFKDFNCVVLATNDRYLNFLDSKTKKIMSRFQAPDIQNHMMFLYDRKQLYTACTSSGTIYIWNVAEIFSPEFLEAIRTMRENYKMVISEIMYYHNFFFFFFL
jgi:WD40 repeat protein